MKTEVERSEGNIHGFTHDEFFYSIRITGVYDRSTVPSRPNVLKNIRFSVYHVRDGLVAEELDHELALAALVQFGLMPLG